MFFLKGRQNFGREKHYFFWKWPKNCKNFKHFLFFLHFWPGTRIWVGNPWARLGFLRSWEKGWLGIDLLNDSVLLTKPRIQDDCDLLRFPNTYPTLLRFYSVSLMSCDSKTNMVNAVLETA